MPLFIFAFIGHIGHPFNLVFFSRHLDVDNAATGMIIAFTVVLEIPSCFLWIGSNNGIPILRTIGSV